MEYRTCKKCGINKPLTIEFFPQGTNKRNNREFPYWYKSCKVCLNEQSLTKNRGYRHRNRKRLADAQKEYRTTHKEQEAITKKKWVEDNKGYVREQDRLAKRKKRQNPLARLKDSISAIVRQWIKKDGKSIKKYLPYTLEQLKSHIENKFEPWMTWDNQGVYRVKEWNENDQSTWKWQLDHVKPHSWFPYISMEDPLFQECWALDNLRPYSAKDNIKNGNRR
jgi:HrpA-like RNA helicase